MTDPQDHFLKRYSRQIRLPQIGKEGQQRLQDSQVLVVGMGGLGSPASMYLAATGIGRLVISDFDRVELSNLQRQLVHKESNINEPKALSAKQTLKEINSTTEITAIDWQLDEDELLKEAKQADVILDCSDNFETRFALNQVSQQTSTPLVSGAAIRFDGQLSVYNPQISDSPCYQCLFPEEGYAETCAAEGVLAPVVGVIGTLQALEVVKLITGSGNPLVGRLLLFDGLRSEFQTIRLVKDPSCPVCS